MCCPLVVKEAKKDHELLSVMVYVSEVSASEMSAKKSFTSVLILMSISDDRL